MNNVWIQSGNSFYPDETTSQRADLPIGVYRFKVHPMRGPYLELMHERFEFPYKIYGTESEFVDRVLITWENISTNLGVLLNGIRGTGKTVTAELIANGSYMPVILVSDASDILPGFLSQIEQDIVVFFDEYDKSYKDSDSLLTVMDGVDNNVYRRLFLLTSNNNYISQSMKQRPSRIRYIKEFGNLEIAVIEEVVKDTLEFPEFIKDTMDVISQMPIITMDMIKTVVQEVNIHRESPKVFRQLLNINGDVDDNLYNLYRLNPDGTKELLVAKGDAGGRFNNKNLHAGNAIEVKNDQVRYRAMIDVMTSPTSCIVYPNDLDEDGDPYKLQKERKEHWVFERDYVTHGHFYGYGR